MVDYLAFGVARFGYFCLRNEECLVFRDNTDDFNHVDYFVDVYQDPVIERVKGDFATARFSFLLICIDVMQRAVL